MIIAGEKFNSSIPKTFDMLKSGDEEQIIALAKRQEAAGAHYLDINTSMFQEEELNKLLYLIDLVKEHVNCGIMIDSPSPEVVEKAAERAEGRTLILNSVTLAQRLYELIPVAKKYNAGVVALPIGKDGMPENAEKRVENAKELIYILAENGIDHDRIYIDVLAETLAVNQQSALHAINTITEIRNFAPDVHLICGLSNISFGLPKRALINAAFLTAAVYSGLDSAIMDITNDALRASLFSALAISGRDEYCMDYINAVSGV